MHAGTLYLTSHFFCWCSKHSVQNDGFLIANKVAHDDLSRLMMTADDH